MGLPPSVFFVVVLLATVAVFAESESPKEVGVVYLIDVFSPRNNTKEASNAIPESDQKDLPSLLSINPLPDDDNLPDGIYYRPADGKALKTPEVHVPYILCLHNYTVVDLFPNVYHITNLEENLSRMVV